MFPKETNFSFSSNKKENPGNLFILLMFVSKNFLVLNISFEYFRVVKEFLKKYWLKPIVQIIRVIENKYEKNL